MKKVKGLGSKKTFIRTAKKTREINIPALTMLRHGKRL